MTIPASVFLLLVGPEQAQPEVPSYGAQLVQTLIALVVVCILAYVILRWGLARFVAPRTGQGPMEVLARLPLEGRQGLLVVRVANRVFLLATGSTAPSLLAELDPDRWAEEMAHWTDEKGPSLFQRVLQGVQSRPSGPAQARRAERTAKDRFSQDSGRPDAAPADAAPADTRTPEAGISRSDGPEPRTTKTDSRDSGRRQAPRVGED